MSVSALPLFRTQTSPRRMIRRLRRRLAAAIYPGQLPVSARKPKRRRHKSPPAPVVRAVDVSYADARAFFDRRRPTYEKLARAVAPYVHPDGVILDVGANIGYFSLVLGEVTGFRGTAYLYEPVPHLAELCIQTLAGVPYHTVINVHGLADADAVATIFLARDGNLGWNTLVADKASNMSELEIELRRFDPATVHRVPDLIKIDVEGAEHRVLAGLLPALRGWDSARPVILCEVGWGDGHPEWESELSVFDELAALGYRAQSLTGAPIDLRTLHRTTDVLFVPARIG